MKRYMAMWTMAGLVLVGGPACMNMGRRMAPSSEAAMGRGGFDYGLNAPAAPAPLPSVPVKTAPSTGVRYPYIVTELRRIGILAGVMLTILVILVLVLP